MTIALESGAQDYIMKPFDEAILTGKVRADRPAVKRRCNR